MKRKAQVCETLDRRKEVALQNGVSSQGEGFRMTQEPQPYPAGITRLPCPR